MTGVRSRWIAWSSIALAAIAPAGCRSDRSFADYDTHPGGIVHAHYHTMQTNAEAADFILYRNEFVGETAELTPAGRDHVPEIAARAQTAPFPILIERSENNADPDLDERRRQAVVSRLVEMGLSDAEVRTIVSPAYGRGISGIDAERSTNVPFLSRHGDPKSL